MKKALRMVALGAALLIGGATLAQAQAGGAQQQGERRGGLSLESGGSGSRGAVRRRRQGHGWLASRR